MRTRPELVQKDTMGLKLRRRTVYIGTIAAMLAMIGGVALAAVSIGGTSAIYQGTEHNGIGSVAGLTWMSTNLVQLGTAVTSTSGCTSSGGCDVSATSAVVCASASCPAGAWVEEVQYSVLATPVICSGAATAIAEIFISYTDGSGVNPAPNAGYFLDSTAATGTTTVTMVIDVTVGGVPDPTLSAVDTAANCG